MGAVGMAEGAGERRATGAIFTSLFLADDN